MSQSDFVTRGQALVTSGQYQEAVKVCRLGLLGRPTTVEGRIVLGQALLALKRFDEVLAEMRVALELDHTSVAAQMIKGEALLRKGDAHAALDVLAPLKTIAPKNPQLTDLLAEAARGPSKGMSASHPSVGFVGGSGAGDSVGGTADSTRNYPNHSADEEDTEPKDQGIEDTGGSYTRPTSLAAPGAAKRSNRQQAMPEPEPARPRSSRQQAQPEHEPVKRATRLGANAMPQTGAKPRRALDPIPSEDVLAVGDRSGTVEVDPEQDGVELDPDDDFGSLASPPRSTGKRPQHIEGARGSVRGASKSPAPQRSRRPKQELSSVELDDDDMVELEDAETPDPPSRRGPGPGTAVRNAVKMPSGPIDMPYSPAAARKTAQAPQPPLAQVIAQQPHMLQMSPLPPPQPLPLPPVNPRSAIAAALPTAAAMPIPQYGQQPMPLGGPINAALPTMAANLGPGMNPAQQQSAAAVDALFNGGQPQDPQAWARSTVLAGGPGQVGPQPPHPQRARNAADEPTRQAGDLDPRIAAEMPQSGSFADSGSASGGKPLKTGMRRGRSKLQVAMWILVGAIVIGGGVFAGFQIRAMRLQKQITAARKDAVNVAKADTWQGWSGARDRLAGIARASATVDNRAALARARAILAYEFGDGLAEATAALEKLGDQGGLDTAIARAYLALAQNDPKAAKAAADRATEMSSNDAAVLYVSGQAALLDGDYKTAITNLRAAQEREPRPLYAVGLARATAATGAWDDALSAVDRALGAMPDHPAGAIERALLLAASGRIGPENKMTGDVRAQLLKLISEGNKPLDKQTVAISVSPAQLALANLALAQIDFALRDMPGALAALKAAADVRADEQRFGEEAIDTLYAIGELQRARAAAVAALATWPQSRRARISQAQVAIALGKPGEALEVFKAHPDALVLPRGLAVRGHALLATGNLDGARADFDAALKKMPALELALIGRAWIDLADGDVEEARKRIEPKFNPNSSGAAMTTVYAAILRASPDPAGRENAKKLLDKVVTGPPTVDVARAQLELGRVYRDMGATRDARNAFADSIRNGSVEAKLDNALLLIEDRDPIGGRDTLDALLRDAGPNPNPRLVLEGARARMLAGDNTGAAQLLEQADKIPTVERWQLDRERGRLFLRKGEVTKAAEALGKALDTSSKDVETFLVAADIVATDIKQATALSQKLKLLVPQRLKNVPEALIINGKLALAAENTADAESAYNAANKALENAVPRRLAQAHFGLAVVAFFKGDDPAAQTQLDLVLETDPSIYAAYLFAADLAKQKRPAVALELARKAVTFNPDFVDGWAMLGELAARLGKTKDLTEAITRVTALAPESETLKTLRTLR